MRLRDAAVGIALGEAANRVREVGGNNTGEDVAKYLEATWIDVPAPWCMAFVYWACVSASQLLGVENPLRYVPKRALVASLIDTAKEHQWIIQPRAAVPGDLVAFRWSSGHHVGFLVDTPLITTAESGPTVGPFWTVEGNTSPGVGLDTEEQEREGDGVFVKERQYIADRVNFIRWDENLLGPRKPMYRV